MAFKIMLANNATLLDKAFKLRHQVFVGEEGLLQPTPDGRIIDRFDTFPSTHILVVITQTEEVVGTFRLALDSAQGLPADEYYNFRQHIPQNSHLLHGGFFCVSQAHRSTKLTMGLILMSAYFAISHGVTHVLAPINPKIGNLLKRIGFTQIADEFIEPHTGAIMAPLILNTSHINDFFLNFIRQNQLNDFLHDYERWFYQAGEEIIKAGTVGEEAFHIIEGKVQVKAPQTDLILGELGTGEIFGELALLTNEPRSADVIALTDVQMMVLPKEAFMSRFLTQPEQVLHLMQLLAKRTQSLINQLTK